MPFPPAERRSFPRYHIPLFLESPGICDVPLAAVDACAGGFKVISPHRLEPGAPVEVSFEIDGVDYRNCKAFVAWVQENESSPPSWTAGLLIVLPDDRRAQLAEAMARLAEETEEASASRGAR